MLIVGQECPPLIVIDGNTVTVGAMAFSANGGYLVSDGQSGPQVWRIKDAKEMARMEASEHVLCLAVSPDDRWIAAGMNKGIVVWSAESYEQVFSEGEITGDSTSGLHFSPDSTRLVVASKNGTASVWDIATSERKLTLQHDMRWVVAVKYSPQGDRIATATSLPGDPNRNDGFIRVWDSTDGRLLMDIPVKIAPVHNSGLLWFNDHLFILSDDKIREIDASTGSIVSDWPVPHRECNYFSCIALSQNGEFIAHSSGCEVTFWDTSTHTQLGLIHHPRMSSSDFDLDEQSRYYPRSIYSIAFSPDSQFLAISGEGGVIAIQHLSRIAVSIISR